MLNALSFDHRGSILKYLEQQATGFEVSQRKDIASALRATASSIAAEIDIQQGKQGIATPISAIIYETVAAFGGVSYQEVIGPTKGSTATQRVRFAAIWLVKKRMGCGDEKLEVEFHRERSTINSGFHRAEQLRVEDLEFKRITDNLLAQEMRCENCLHPLLSA